MRFYFNPYRERRRAFHRSLEGYAVTPLVRLGPVYVKDESQRLGLNAFKVLGGSWAMHRVLEQRAVNVFSCATDGNHGRAVAATARRLGYQAVVFVPANMVPARIENLRREGARVEVVEGTYDEALRRCAAESEAQGWQVISDSGYGGYLEIPQWVVEGYATIFEECEEQMAERGWARPRVVMIQAGVGGLLCAAVRHFRAWGDGTQVVCVEPEDADCLMASITSEGGRPRASQGSQNSIMSGLNCGEVSLSAWEENRDGVDLFLTIGDVWAERAMRRLAAAGVVAGESGAAGLAGWLALWEAPEFAPAREQMGLTEQTPVLVINTEGATDPEGYRRVVG
ncbi:MAG: diaminopropionate ammonia-lyase [Bryobacterales bacterium]|nr:diaminopropionate ammonia-lyase [Bryobacterales bacterium]